MNLVKMNCQLLCSPGLIFEVQKKTSSLSQHHPVGDLNTLLAKLKHELLELLLHLHMDTCSALVDLRRYAFGIIRNRLVPEFMASTFSSNVFRQE
jgi:hypothetical protein